MLTEQLFSKAQKLTPNDEVAAMLVIAQHLENIAKALGVKVNDEGTVSVSSVVEAISDLEYALRETKD